MVSTLSYLLWKWKLIPSRPWKWCAPKSTISAMKVMPLALLCWSTISEVHVGGMAVEAEPSHQYLITCCCFVAKWCPTRKGIRSKGVSLNPSMKKKWHPVALRDACWMFMEPRWSMWTQWGSGWCISAVATVSGSPPQVQIFMSSMQTLVHGWLKCVASDGDCVERQCVL